MARPAPAPSSLPGPAARPRPAAADAAAPADLLLVDGANVVGSRPDGWWRDRRAAARTLHGRLVHAVAAGALTAPVVLVLEGAAVKGVPEGEAGGVRVVHAPGSGDDALVGLAGPGATLVSADRELRARVTAAGAACVGPSWLLERLDGA